jgi:hypothetical protein
MFASRSEMILSRFSTEVDRYMSGAWVRCTMCVVRKHPVNPTAATSPTIDKARRIFIPADF